MGMSIVNERLDVVAQRLDFNYAVNIPVWQKQIDKIDLKRSTFSNIADFLLITVRFLKTDYVLLDHVSSL